MAKSKTILVCRCELGRVLPAATVEKVLAQARASGAAIEAVDDLCGLAARRDPVLTQAAEAAAKGDLRIAACFPRAVRWLFSAAGADLPAGAVIANLRSGDPEQAVSALIEGGKFLQRTRELPLAARGRESPESKIQNPKSEIQNPKSKIGGWFPWFPVIDYSRCNHCRQCLNFCLFGVYAASDPPAERKVMVKSPANCKTNCPACARVCPQAAIIFPKYKTAPINGDEVTAENLRAEDAGGDLAGLIDNDLHAALRRRARLAKERFTAERERLGATRNAGQAVGLGMSRIANSAANGPTPTAQAPMPPNPNSEIPKPLMSLPVAGVVPPAAMQVLQAARQRAMSQAEKRPTPNSPDSPDKSADEKGPGAAIARNQTA